MGKGAVLKQWYMIRDYLLGDNYTTQDFFLAYSHAKTCDHPDAVYIVHTFDTYGKCPGTCKEAFELFLTSDDPRGKCFAFRLWQRLPAGIVGQEFAARKCLKESVDSGYDYAVWMNGYHGLIFGLSHKDLKNKSLLFKAAKLGSVEAMYHFALLVSNQDTIHWKWMGKAMIGGCFSARVVFYRSYYRISQPNESTYYQIGKYLTSDHPALPSDFTRSYKTTKLRIERMLTAWILCARRLKIHKDIIPKISKLIKRNECLYS